MTYREKMMENRENLGWCKPLSYLDSRIIIATNERRVVGVQLDGKDVPAEPEKLRKIAAMINPGYDTDALEHDFETAVATYGQELPCCECPWFNICDAMDDE